MRRHRWLRSETSRRSALRDRERALHIDGPMAGLRCAGSRRAHAAPSSRRRFARPATVRARDSLLPGEQAARVEARGGGRAVERLRRVIAIAPDYGMEVLATAGTSERCLGPAAARHG